MIIRTEFTIYGRAACEIRVDERFIMDLKNRFKHDTYFTDGNGHKAGDPIEITEDTIKSVLRYLGWWNEKPTDKDEIIFHEEVLCKNIYYPKVSTCNYGELLKYEIKDYLYEEGETTIITYENDGMWSETYVEDEE